MLKSGWIKGEIKMMKKTLLLTIFLLLAANLVAATYTTVEGETITLIADQLGNSPTTWTIVSGDLHGYPITSIFSSNPSPSNSVDFTSPITGTFTVRATQGVSSQNLNVQVDDLLIARNFGHYCYGIDTSNCVDMQIYGSVLASQNIMATDIYGSGIIAALSSLRIGNLNQVYLSPTLVRLPNTEINGNLNFSGYLHSYTGLITLTDDVEMAQSLNVTDTTYLYRVAYIANNGNPISIDASLDVVGSLLAEGVLTALNGAVVHGELNVYDGDALVSGNIYVGQDAEIGNNVYINDTVNGRLMGNVVLNRNCPGAATRMYQSGQDTIIEIGTC